MQQLEPYVKADPEVPVRVCTYDGTVRDGWAVGWRGDRVDDRWRTEMGNHVGWVPAADVERVGPAGLTEQ
jgi:hypothetical protein